MPNPWDNDPIVGQAPASSPFGPRPVIQEAPKEDSPGTGYRWADPQHGRAEPIPGGPADMSGGGFGTSNLSGNDYLKTLDAPSAGMVKALAEGRKSFPSGAALRAPYWQQMLTHVSNYDPGFDEVNYTARAGTRRDFTSGVAARNIRALNTAIGHLGHLEEQIPGTASHAFTPLNAIENTGRRLTGDAGPTNFDTTVSALAGELTAVYRGSGGAEADIQRYIQQLSPNASHEQKVGAVRNIVGLLKSRLDALNDQYRQGMGTTAQQLQLLDPQAQLIVQHLGGFDAAGAPQDHPGGPAGPGAGNGGPPPPPMPNDQMGAATGSTKEVVDPNLTPVRREYMARLQAGQSGTELVGFLRQAGVADPALLKRAGEQAAWRRKHPNTPIETYDTSAIDHLTEQMGAVNRGLNAVGQSDLGAGAAAAGNAATGGYLPDIIGATGGNEQQARSALDYSAQDHPTSALAGSIVGGTTAAMGGEAALARGAGMAPGFARSLAADTGYGALAGSGASPDNRLGGAGLGALAGAGGSVAGQAIVRGASNTLRGVTNRNVNALAEAGVEPMTFGQVAGGKLKSIEDKATSIPIVGEMIQARRMEGVRSFNSKAFDQALAPINGKVGTAVGEDAVGRAHELVGQAFTDALKGKTAIPDEPFIAGARGPMQRLAMNKRVGPEIVQEIEATTQGLFDSHDGSLSGENMQAFLQGLRQIRQGYKSDPLYSSLIKPSIQGIENAVEGMFKRQAPEVMPKFNAAKAAYRRLSILSDAVDRGKNTEGVFTPGQLGMADRANAKKFDGKISSASGQSPFFDLQRAGQNVLPSKVPESGTTPRALMALAPGAIATGGAGIGYAAGDAKTGTEAGLGLAGVLAALYTKRGQSFLVSALLKRPEKVRAAGESLKRLAPVGGAAGAVLTTSGQ